MMNYLRAMTGAIILYDHTTVHGAFSSKSEVKVRRNSVFSYDWSRALSD